MVARLGSGGARVRAGPEGSFLRHFIKIYTYTPQTVLEKTVEKQVIAVPLRACEGLSSMATKRQEQIDTLKDELYDLENGLQRL